MEFTIQQVMQRGITAHNAGNLREAERAYREILRSQPNHPDAWHNLGLIAMSVYQLEDALSLFETAVNLHPNGEKYWVSYINGLVKAKRIKDAKQAIKKAKKKGLDAKKLQALANQSKVLAATEAPSQQELRNLFEHYQNGQFPEAEKLALSITREFPKDPVAWKVLSEVLRITGRYSEALNAGQKAVALSPQDAEAHNNLGITLEELGRLHESATSYRRAIALEPDSAEAHNNLGVTLKKLGRLDEALASYKQAIALKPKYAEAHRNLGITLRELGRLDDALASFKQAVVLKPDYAQAHRQLSLLKKFNSQDEQYLKMVELSLDKNISEEQRCHINFGLAKACEDLGDYEQAYTYYGEGNVLRKKLLGYDINQDIDLFRKIKFNYPRIERNSIEPDKLSKNLMPVFIVGMPRSGTTLVEQILSSHTRVTGAGELDFVEEFGKDLATGITAVNNRSMLNFREKYLDEMKKVSNGKFIVTDKMPQNFIFIGLLAAAFPEAKIIHVKRDPAAVCWANYKQYFQSKNIGYCYSIDDIISYHELYKNLMKFWTNALNKRIYELNYELLTVNQENETRKLIEYLCLDWDENCLSPQNNPRSVATASNLQVRQEVYQGSSEQWKKYQPFLDGAFDFFLSLPK